MPDFYKNFIGKKIGKDLTHINSRNELFNSLFKKKVPKQSWLNLRNSLANDIGKASFKDNLTIYYNIKNKKVNEYKLEQLRNDLLKFGYEIKEIIKIVRVRSYLLSDYNIKAFTRPMK